MGAGDHKGKVWNEVVNLNPIVFLAAKYKHEFIYIYLKKKNSHFSSYM